MIEKKRSVSKTTDDYIRITDLWGLFRPRWHWFAVSLLLCIGVAVLYLMSTPSSYTRTASLLVKEDSKKGSSGPSASDFSDLGIFRNNTNINNEITTLQSRTLMIEVVRRLHLDEVYSVREGLKRIELYGTSPYSVSLKNSVGYHYQSKGQCAERGDDSWRRRETDRGGYGLVLGVQGLQKGVPVECGYDMDKSKNAEQHARASWHEDKDLARGTNGKDRAHGAEGGSAI